MSVEIKIEGLEQVRKNLKLLSKDVQFKGARFAGRKAANVIKEAAQQKASTFDNPETSEDVAKNIAVRFSPKDFKKNGNIVFRVGVLGGAKRPASEAGGSKTQPGGDTWYWRFLEFGTSRQAAQPFLRPAMSENIDKSTNVFVVEFNKWLTRRVRKLKKG